LKGVTEKYINALEVILFYQYLILTSNMKSKIIIFFNFSRLLMSENYEDEVENFYLSYLI